MEKPRTVEARSRVAIIAGKDQQRIVNEVTRASIENFSFCIVSPDEDYNFAVAIGRSHDEDLIRKYGWRGSQEIYSAQLLEVQLEIVDESQLIGRYALRLVTTEGSGPVVGERQISIGQDNTPGQLLDCLDWVAGTYLPGDIDDFAKKQATYGQPR